MLNREIALFTKVLQKNNNNLSRVNGILGCNNKIYPSLSIPVLDKKKIFVIFNVEIRYFVYIVFYENVSKQMKNLICKTYDGLSTNL